MRSRGRPSRRGWSGYRPSTARLSGIARERSPERRRRIRGQRCASSFERGRDRVDEQLPFELEQVRERDEVVEVFHARVGEAVELILADGLHLERRGVEDDAIIINIERDDFGDDCA